MDEIIFWHWWVFAITLLIIELFAPGAFFLWMSVSAFVTGVILLMVPGLSWEYQIFFFSALSLASIIAWRAYLRKHPTETDRPLLNRRSAQYVGRTFTLDEPIVNGQGKIRVDDTLWKVHGKDCPGKTRVKVVGVNGVVLEVKRID
ncbi:MAG: NfeD family protein [Pseudomonadota bacterium]